MSSVNTPGDTQLWPLVSHIQPPKEVKLEIVLFPIAISHCMFLKVQENC